MNSVHMDRDAISTQEFVKFMYVLCVTVLLNVWGTWVRCHVFFKKMQTLFRSLNFEDLELQKMPGLF